MQKYEKLAIVLIILYAVSTIGGLFSDVLFANFFHDGALGMFTSARVAQIIKFFFSSLMSIGISIVLFITAKKDKTQPWLWALLGLCFGIFALVLYYTICIFEILKTVKQNSKKSIKPVKTIEKRT